MHFALKLILMRMNQGIVRKLCDSAGPFILIPKRAIDLWLQEFSGSDGGEAVEDKLFQTNNLLLRIPFYQFEILRIGEPKAVVVWEGNSERALICQWIGADSAEALLEFGRSIDAKNEWMQELEIDLGEREYSIMDYQGFVEEAGPPIDVMIEPGIYRFSATYAENSSIMAIVVRYAPRLDGLV
jgi:hypothetical protein